jgi:hypothetical protein
MNSDDTRSDDDEQRDNAQFWQHRQAQSYFTAIASPPPSLVLPRWSCARRKRLSIPAADDADKTAPSKKPRPSKRQRKRAQEEKERVHDDPNFPYVYALSRNSNVVDATPLHHSYTSYFS